VIPGETVLSARALGIPDDEHVSEFQVMQSPGNQLFYIGTVRTRCADTACIECERSHLPVGYPEPNSRETDYFHNRNEAEMALATYNRCGELYKRRT
jgi:hypothetical protein